MNVDSLLREQGQRLRDEVRATLDVETAWEELAWAHRRRRRVLGAVSVAAAAASVVGVLMLASVGPPDANRQATPAESPTGESRGPSPATSSCVDTKTVQCLGDGMVRVRNGVTFRFVTPAGYELEVVQNADTRVTDLYQGTSSSGVAVLADVRAADPGAGELDAETLARWMASRSYLPGATLGRGRLQGRQAWTVSVAEPASPWEARTPYLADSCNDQQLACRPLLRSPGGWETGPWTGMTFSYWLIDVPGNGVAAVWAYSFEDDPAFMERNEQVVDTLVLESAD